MMRADGAGRTVYLSVCLEDNYKALEAPADGFAPAFLWAPGGSRSRSRSGAATSRTGDPQGPSEEGLVPENCYSLVPCTAIPTPTSILSDLAPH